MYWKAGDPWYSLESTIVGANLTFSITDGGLGDTDGAINGTIIDPGGAGIDSETAPTEPPKPEPVPVMKLAMLIAMSGMLVLLGAYNVRRRKQGRA